MIQEKVVKDEIVIIKQTAPFRLLPKEVRSDVSVTVGSKWKKGTKSLLMGLTPQENEYYLPEIIQVSPDSRNWEQAVKDFYANLTIDIPFEGLRLNKAMTKKTVWLRGKELEIPYPVNVDQYIQYKQLYVDNSIANSPDLIDEGTYVGYIVDEQLELDKQNSLRKEKNKLFKVYTDLVETDDDGNFKDEKVMRHVLFCLNINPDALSNDSCARELENYRDVSIKELEDGKAFDETTLIKVTNDPNLKTKAIIRKLIMIGAIRHTGNYYTHPSNPEKIYGTSLDDLVSFWESGSDNQTVMEWKAQLMERKKLN